MPDTNFDTEQIFPQFIDLDTKIRLKKSAKFSFFMARVDKAVTSEFRQVVERAYEACRKNRNQWWVLEPFEDFIGIFRGLLFARCEPQVPIPGCVFAFRVFIEDTRLAEPPRVVFDKPLMHPLIFPSGEFCFPVSGRSMSCRSTPLNEIMDHLVDCFFIRKPEINRLVRETFVNAEAANLYKSEAGKAQLWDGLRRMGILSPEEEAPPPSE